MTHEPADAPVAIREGVYVSVFSAREIRQLKPRDKTYKVTESAPRGEGRLIVRVHPSGLKEFYYRYRLNGPDRLIRIGRFEQNPGDGGMKLEEARAQLAKLVGIQRATGCRISSLRTGRFPQLGTT